MKKFIGIIAALLLLSACGGNNQKPQDNYEIAFVQVADEDQKLFNEEIGTNAELYLEGLAEKYKISQNLPITVIAAPESEDGTAEVSLDWGLVSVPYSQLGIDITELVKQCKYDKVMDESAFGGVLDLGEDAVACYIYFPSDQRSFATLPNKLSALKQFIKENEASGALAGKTEIDQLVTTSVWSIAQGASQQAMSAFNCKLSNGKKFRVFFLLEKK